MLSEQARATIAAADARRTRALRGEAPFVDPRLAGPVDLATVGVGYHVYARTDGPLADVRMWVDGEAVGGIVVATSIVWDDIDDRSNVPAFTVLDPNLLGSPRARAMILARQVDVDRLAPFDVGKVRAVVRAIVREVADNGPAKGPIPEFHKQLISDANRLIAVLDQKDIHR